MPRYSTAAPSPVAAARTAIRVVLPVVLAVAPVLTASARSKIGLIGDSMMVATNSNQMCGSGEEVLQCFEGKLGDHDLAFSHGAGDFPWSIARRLGYGDGQILNAADDGEEWKDALAQAQVITSDPDVETVFIQLGANDVCADYGHDFTDDLAETAAEIDATLSHLVDNLPDGSRIYWSGIIDVVGFRNALADRRHSFAFKSCQGLWDLDAEDLSDEAVRSVCKELDIPDFACDGLTELDSIAEPLLEALVDFFSDAYDVETPCGAVLDGRNSEADLARARSFNIALNQLLESKARAWSESQDRVDIVFTNRVFGVEILPYFVSRLDCFHPNRAGQMNLAEEIWRGFEPMQAGNVAFFMDEFDSEDMCTQEFTTWDSCWYDYGDSGFTVGVDARNRLEIAKEISERRQHFVARDLGDLSDKTFAWMSFNHKRQYLDDSGDHVIFEVYANGSWHELDVFQGGGNDRNAHPGKYYDLTPYLSSDVRIQFKTSDHASMENGDSVRLDNFEIFSWGPTPLPEPAFGATGGGLVLMAFAAMAGRKRRPRHARGPARRRSRRRILVVVTIGAMIGWSSATPAWAKAAEGSSQTTRPVIAEDVSPVESIAPISKDGHPGEGFVRKPPGSGPFPAAILIHGGLTRRPTEALRQYTLSTHPSRFLAAGYVVVVITYRSRDIDPTAQTPKSVSDCVAAIELVKALPYVDPESILVTGTSGGGDLTLEAAAQTEVAAIAPEEPAAVLMAGLVVADSSVARKADYLKLYRDRADHREFRAKLARIQSPILILQGDHNTHSGLNRFTAGVLIPELRAAGRTFEVVTYPGEPHAFSFYSDAERTPRPAAALEAFRDIDRFARRFVEIQPVSIDPSRVQYVPVGYGEEPAR